MTDERDKPSRLEKSSARTTARDVPFVRDAGSDAEPAPRGKRPEQLPRDPTYEAELAQVELAVLRNPVRRDDPSTKQGGRRGYAPAQTEAPDSVTPESPGTRLGRDAQPSSPHPPSSSGRSAASGTLLSIGGVDPRAKTERTLETPRMYFSQADAGGEVYFKPGKIPAVTVHQTLETETVKLADSIDPRRAKTLPRIDRHVLARYVEEEHPQESAAPSVLTGPGSSVDFDEPASLPFEGADDYEPASSLGEHEAGQIHASLSPFRDHAEPSYSFDGVPTRAEPLAARRASDIPPSLGPDPSTVPTQRDLPMHRIEASLPPPPAVPSIASPSDPTPALATAHAIAASSAPSFEEEPVELDHTVRKPLWINLTAFGIALLLTIVLGLWLTRSPAPSLPEQAQPAAAPAPEPAVDIAAPSPTEPVVEAEPPAAVTATAEPLVAPPSTPAPAVRAPSKPSSLSSSPNGSRKPATTKATRETIF
ncbi:MAG: hypothetical protein K0R38_1186 [Polyangiaceae bacterium]|jgi:hypothetical protein|nr:hypothetical protein [Polyangiaceae bacterium]